MTKIFAILDTETNQFVKMPSGKVAWESTGAAKSAFLLHMVSYDKNWKKPKFEEQSRYKIVELTEYYWMYKELQE